MFHKSNLGSFGEGLPCDMDGNVPEAGDCWQDMSYDAQGAVCVHSAAHDADCPYAILAPVWCQGEADGGRCVSVELAIFTDDDWDACVSEAVSATQEATEALGRWQKANT